MSTGGLMLAQLAAGAALVRARVCV